MVGFVKKHAGTFAVAFITAAVTAGAPAIAAIVQHAHYADRAGVAKNAKNLGGVPSSGYYKAGTKVADSDMLDGQDSSSFLGVGQKAADSDKLDGQDSTAFLGATAKAADSELLDGKDSTEYALAANSAAKAYVLVNTTPAVVTGKSNPSGWAVTRPSTGVYCLNPPSGSGVDVNKETGVVSVDWKLSAGTAPKPAYLAYVDSDSVGAGCAAPRFAVRTFEITGTGGVPDPTINADPSNNVAFTLLIT